MNIRRVIGVDIDEVLCCLLQGLTEWHNTVYGTNLRSEEHKSYNLWNFWGGTEKQAVQKVLEFYKTEYFRNLKPVPGSVEGINTLSTDKENKLIVLTSRPESTLGETKEWIEHYFNGKFLEIYCASHYFNSGNKKKKSLCSELGIDFLVEDCLEYSLECANNKTKVLLFDLDGTYGWNQDYNLPKKLKMLPTGIIRVKSWNEVIENVYKPLS